METVRSATQARVLFNALPRPLGFVPTMGALHAGHLELVRRARERSASVAASIFVNPMQFGPHEDLGAYPRDEAGDRAKLAGAGVDALFIPEAQAMYAPDFTTFVDVGPLGQILEGAVRPQHFRGVTTVMTKLLHIVAPERLFLGQKDAQQAAIVRKMIFDLNFPVELEVVPTVREDDGLAMSSRNRYLDAELRAAAPTLHRALLATRDALERGASKSDAVAAGAAALSRAAKLDYLDVVDRETFASLERPRPPMLIVGAARFGSTRLLDNVRVE
jgi:pantoate--beta-alanine ligase